MIKGNSLLWILVWKTCSSYFLVHSANSSVAYVIMGCNILCNLIWYVKPNPYSLQSVWFFCIFSLWCSLLKISFWPFQACVLSTVVMSSPFNLSYFIEFLPNLLFLNNFSLSYFPVWKRVNLITTSILSINSAHNYSPSSAFVSQSIQ